MVACFVTVADDLNIGAGDTWTLSVHLTVRFEEAKRQNVWVARHSKIPPLICSHTRIAARHDKRRDTNLPR
jgi:hypothetical protein